MPSRHSPGGDSGESAFESLVDKLGEDPSRFLDRDIYSPSDRASPLLLARARIQAIDYLDVLSAWRAVERALGTPDAPGPTRDECPRESILALLEQRERELQERGERDERLEKQGAADRDVPEREWHIVQDGERVPWDEARGSSARSKLSQSRAETDGGESS